MALALKPASGLHSRSRQTGGVVFLCVQSEVQTKAGNAVIEWCVIAVIVIVFFFFFFLLALSWCLQPHIKDSRWEEGADVIVADVRL